MTYTIKDLRPTDFTDPHGNAWVNAAFEEFGEPVVLVVKDPTKLKVGFKLDGEIRTVISKAGKEYNRFFRDKPQQGFSGGSGTPPKREYQPRDDAAIQAQWAIGQANTQVVNGIVEADELESLAKHFFGMIDRVKAGAGGSDDQISGDPVKLSDIPF